MRWTPVNIRCRTQCLSAACQREIPAAAERRKIYHIRLLPAETIENRQDGQRIVLLVEKASDGKRTSNRRLPPKNAFTPTIGRFHDHSVHLVQKLLLPCGRFRERSQLIHI